MARKKLTRRQEDVLAVIGDGHRGKQAAELLGICDEQVYWHVKHLKEIFGVQKIGDLVPCARNYFGLVGGKR